MKHTLASSTSRPWTGILGALLVTCACAAAHAGPAPVDPWEPLAFLEGTWEAHAQGERGTTTVGLYTFRRELGGHVLARHGANTACRGVDRFDCEHGDLLYVFDEAGRRRAIYFDNEGHVIRYDVTTPRPDEVVFLSEPAPGPRFRLTYRRDGKTMTGKFQMQAPGGDTWTSYLEWRGDRQ